jgi:hypothetical protein
MGEREGSGVALSDQLKDLAVRAKQVEERVAAASQKSRAQLEADVDNARESSQAQTDALHTKAQAGKGKISAWWDKLEKSWHEHVAAVRKERQERKAAHDAKAAQHAAEKADEDASYAIDYAYAAIEEAQYAVLDAVLAHRHADDLAQA